LPIERPARQRPPAGAQSAGESGVPKDGKARSTRRGITAAQSVFDHRKKKQEMRYLVTSANHNPFFTEWFEPENHFATGMVVYDLKQGKYMKAMGVWEEIETDSP
jgi:hypothetical protein